MSLFYSFNANESNPKDLYRLTEALFLLFERKRRMFFVDLFKLNLPVNDFFYICVNYPTVENLEDLLIKLFSTTTLDASNQGLFSQIAIDFFSTLFKIYKNTDPFGDKTIVHHSILWNNFLNIQRFKSIWKNTDLKKCIASITSTNEIWQEESTILYLYSGKNYITHININLFLRNWIYYVEKDSDFLKILFKIPMPLIDFYLLVTILHIDILKKSQPYFITDLIGLCQIQLPLNISSGTKKMFASILQAVLSPRPIAISSELKNLLKQTNTDLKFFGLDNIFY